MPDASNPTSTSAAPGAGPFAGLLVVDLTRILAGPYCSLLLAALGARVIKVERPAGGDEARAIGPIPDAAPDRSAYFQSVNRGKESIALDLEVAEDRAVFERLLDRADVLAENFRPGVMEKLGYGWDRLQTRWPRLMAPPPLRRWGVRPHVVATVVRCKSEKGVYVSERQEDLSLCPTPAQLFIVPGGHEPHPCIAWSTSGTRRSRVPGRSATRPGAAVGEDSWRMWSMRSATVAT